MSLPFVTANKAEKLKNEVKVLKQEAEEKLSSGGVFYWDLNQDLEYAPKNENDFYVCKVTNLSTDVIRQLYKAIEKNMVIICRQLKTDNGHNAVSFFTTIAEDANNYYLSIWNSIYDVAINLIYVGPQLLNDIAYIDGTLILPKNSQEILINGHYFTGGGEEE